jgi:hypothetical protein
MPDPTAGGRHRTSMRSVYEPRGVNVRSSRGFAATVLQGVVVLFVAMQAASHLQRRKVACTSCLKRGLIIPRAALQQHNNTVVKNLCFDRPKASRCSRWLSHNSRQRWWGVSDSVARWPAPAASKCGLIIPRAALQQHNNKGFNTTTQQHRFQGLMLLPVQH